MRLQTARLELVPVQYRPRHSRKNLNTHPGSSVHFVTFTNRCASERLKTAHCSLPQATKGKQLDRENVKGFAEKTKGTIKEGAGKMMGDKNLEAEGKVDKAKGDAHNAAGNLKDAGRIAADALKK
jgi:uncharacterized protein YjbJ (UPF0337 family)